MGSAQKPKIDFFSRYLSVWVALAIILGVACGALSPLLFSLLSSFQLYNVNFVIAILIWLMIYPMMVDIDFKAITSVARNPKGLGITLVVNWLIKPFTMMGIAVLFINILFKGFLPANERAQIIAGMILLGAAPCTAMVFVWSRLTNGNSNYTLTQVAINDLIMIFAFAPLTSFLLGVTSIKVPWGTLILSVILYVVIPLTAGALTRALILRSTGKGSSSALLSRFLKSLKPMSTAALLLTVFFLFGFQGKAILDSPLVIVLIAIPLIVQTYVIYGIGYGAARVLRVPYDIAAPAALIGASNFFELAVAVAISLFGLGSPAALATVVGVLVEVPVMLSLVTISNHTKQHFPQTTTK